MSFQPGENEDIANGNGESTADKDGNHPAREKGTSDVHDGITTRSEENENDDDHTLKSAEK
jgi:hypothetical protein